jgi:hypothetical protein
MLILKFTFISFLLFTISSGSVVENSGSEGYIRSISREIVAVTAATVTDRALLYPADQLIILQQSTGGWIRDLITKASERGNFRFFYKSFWPQLGAVIPASIILYASYGVSKNLLEKRGLGKYESTFYAGALGGVGLSLATCPAEAARTRSVNNINLSQKQSRELRVVYRGFVPSLTKGVLYGSVALTGSDYLISSFFPASMQHSIWAPFITGTIAGSISQVIVSPVDLIKTRVMTDYDFNKTIYDHIKEAYKTRTLMTGMLFRVIRFGPGAGIMIGLINIYRELFNSVFK